MDVKNLLALNQKELLENLHYNRLIFRIAHLAIICYHTGELPTEEFKEAFCTYDRKLKAYMIIGRQEDGSIIIKFEPPTTISIIPGNNRPDILVHEPMDNVIGACTVLKNIIDNKSREIEEYIVKEYTKEERYGKIDYLENEFKTFALNEMEDLSSDNTGAEIYNGMPLKFNFKGRFLDYIKEFKGNLNHIHILT